MQRCIIIGGGHAGAQAAFSLRQQGWRGEIILIGAEPELPYHRPPLSKAFLLGQQTESQLLIRPVTSYQQDSIDLRLHCQVLRLNRQQRQVFLDCGTVLSYDKLLLCTGSTVRRLQIPGAELAGVCYLKTLADTRQLQQQLSGCRQIGLIGGGYVGLELAAALRTMGFQISVFERENRLLSRVTSPQVSAYYLKLHQKHGVTIHTGQQISALTGTDRVNGIATADGRHYPVDLVIAGIGTTAQTRLAEQAGLTVADGIVVNHCGQTSDVDIYAAGDCTRQLEPFSGSNCRIEAVANANEQAKAAATALCGLPVAPAALPWFWSDQYDSKIQIAGLNLGYQQVIVREHQPDQSFSVWYLADGRILAADCINAAKDFMLAKRIISAGQQIPAHILSDHQQDLRHWCQPSQPA
jgi:3-phenylpropionate/trans-cinnamate dioxygenase ferredoxin reductase subunit